MLARPAVLLTPSDPLLVCKQTPSVTYVESTLAQVLILKNFKLPRINTYEKGEGGSLPSKAGLPSKLPSKLGASRVRRVTATKPGRAGPFVPLGKLKTGSYITARYDKA
jgi:hypothetical protein